MYNSIAISHYHHTQALLFHVQGQTAFDLRLQQCCSVIQLLCFSHKLLWQANQIKVEGDLIHFLFCAFHFPGEVGKREKLSSKIKMMRHLTLRKFRYPSILVFLRRWIHLELIWNPLP